MFDLLQLEGELPLFPGIENNLDFFGFTAYLVYFIIHTSIVFFFLRSVRVFMFSVILIVVNLGVYVGVTQFALGTIAFVFAEGTTFTVGTISLISIIIQYNVLWLFFIFLLREFFLENTGRPKQ